MKKISRTLLRLRGNDNPYVMMIPINRTAGHAEGMTLIFEENNRKMQNPDRL